MCVQGWGHSVSCGDVEGAFASGECAHVLEGEVRMGGQVRSARTLLTQVRVKTYEPLGKMASKMASRATGEPQVGPVLLRRHHDTPASTA